MSQALWIPGIQSGTPTWMTVVQALGPSSAFPVVLVGSWIGCGASGTWTCAPMGCWCWSWWPNQRYKTGPFSVWVQTIMYFFLICLNNLPTSSLLSSQLPVDHFHLVAWVDFLPCWACLCPFDEDLELLLSSLGWSPGPFMLVEFICPVHCSLLPYYHKESCVLFAELYICFWGPCSPLITWFTHCPLHLLIFKVELKM